MIKRRFYKQNHGDNSTDSSSSSSDSDSDSIPEVEEEEDDEVAVEEEEEEEKEEDEEEAIGRVKKEKKSMKKQRSPSPGSGYESEDSSGNEVDVDFSGLLANEEEEGQNLKDGQLINEAHVDETDKGPASARNKAFAPEDPIQADLPDCILKCKSVFKCRLCPRIVCLSEDTVRAHLSSKRHARSKKLLGEGRLKLMLNSDGEIEEDQETHAERHSRTVALAQETVAPFKKDSGRQRQSRRRKKRLRGSSKEKSEQSTKNPVKKRRKN